AKREILPPPAFHRLRRRNLGRLRPASNIGKAATSTTGPRCRTNPRDDENGRCSGLSRRAMRNASSPPTAASTITSSFAATVLPLTNTVLLATKPFAPGAISPELPPARELGVCSGQFDILSLNLTAPSQRQPRHIAHAHGEFLPENPYRATRPVRQAACCF
ncbi:MAG: hypothetical protein ACRYF2_11560, partial [Janthinobacterium lividum]